MAGAAKATIIAAITVTNPRTIVMLFINAISSQRNPCWIASVCGFPAKL
jgi:hypothetical protein